MREEWDRLQAGNGRVEFLRTQALLRAVLPTPPARVLDVGGADGVHAERRAISTASSTGSVRMRRCSNSVAVRGATPATSKDEACGCNERMAPRRSSR